MLLRNPAAKGTFHVNPEPVALRDIALKAASSVTNEMLSASG
jgi:hypothetical protein